MRIRSIRPEFWRSSDVSALPIEDRLLFIGLWSYVDDNGVGIDKLSAITADLFADDLETDAPETFARVSRGLATLFERNLIARYTVDGRPYLCITNWDKHQRIDKPGKPRFPRNDAENAVIRESVANPPEKDPVGEGEKGRRGEEENTCSPAPPSSDTTPQLRAVETIEDAELEPEPFELAVIEEPQPDPFEDEFWPAYPRKEGKAPARKKFTTLARKHGAQVIIDGARRYAADPNLPEKQYIPHASTWLNEERWNDPALPPRHVTGSQQRLAEAAQLAQHIANRPRVQNPYQQTGTRP